MKTLENIIIYALIGALSTFLWNIGDVGSLFNMPDVEYRQGICCFILFGIVLATIATNFVRPPTPNIIVNSPSREEEEDES